MTYLCLSVAAAGLAICFALLWWSARRQSAFFEERYEFWYENARSWMNQYWRATNHSPAFDAKQNDRMWQAIQDRLAVDSLVGSATYRGDE